MYSVQNTNPPFCCPKATHVPPASFRAMFLWLYKCPNELYLLYCWDLLCAIAFLIMCLFRGSFYHVLAHYALV